MCCRYLKVLYRNFEYEGADESVAGQPVITTLNNAVSPFRSSLNDLLAIFHEWRGGDMRLKVLELISKVISRSRFCNEQVSHSDSPEMTALRDSGRSVDSELENQYSAILSVMPGTKWVNSSGNEVIVPVGSFVIWKGYYIHAGAKYVVANRRVFFSLGSFRFPPANTVLTVIDNNDEEA
jgi:hypothetical protein